MIEERRFAAMGSDAHLIVVGGATWLADAAIERIRDLERRWSRFLPDSEVSRANARAGSWTVVSPGTAALVERAELARRATAGRFDPSRLTDLVAAGYDRSFDRIDTTAAATSSAAGVAPGRPVLVDTSVPAVRVPEGAGFDPGGIGKGYAGDVVLSELLGQGAAGASVSLGGDVRAGGVGPDGGDWTVVVDDPRTTDDTPLATLTIADGAVATSSRLRRRWRDTGGSRRHHLIDPRSGRPACSPTLTATVIAAEGWQAEALTKVAFTAPVEVFLDALAAADATGLVVTGTAVVRAPGLGRFVTGTPTSPAARGEPLRSLRP